MIYYTCDDCVIVELEIEVIPKKKCPKCGKYMDNIEED